MCEEIPRFIINDRALTGEFKKIRHRIDSIVKRLPVLELLKERESVKDVGRALHQKLEYKRSDFQDIFFANIQRVKESIRVLEEFAKLYNRKASLEFKKVRYSIYELEKKAVKKISAVCHHR